MNVVAISLFSGAGGLDIGAHLAGVKVVTSIDIEQDCISTLRANDLFKDTNVIQGDLHEIKSEWFINELNKHSYDKCIVIGGAPCQPFSKNGYWVGNQSRRGINDPRAKLVNEFLRVVQDVKPDGFVFENVESLLHPTHKVIVDGFIDIIEAEGYSYKIIKANAVDYGVPQKRKRLFIIGTKMNFNLDLPIKTHGNEKERSANPSLKPIVTVGDVMAEFNTPEYFEPEEVVEGKYSDDLKEVPPGMNYKALTEWAGHPNPKFIADKKFWNFLLKLSPDQPSWTITAQPGPWIGPFHWDSRRLRTPEIAAIQTFPKGYKFIGSRRSIQKQIGNAVPPLMGKAMVDFLVDSFLTKEHKDECC